MPSGSKKRKAAKKKKEIGAGAAPHNHHHHHHSAADHLHSHAGDDDLKHRDDDEKESDGEEVSSPASSQEHPNNHHHQFTDWEKEEVEKTEVSSDVQAARQENKSFGGAKEDNEAIGRAIEEERVVKIEPEVKPADDELNIKDTVAEDFEPQKEATNEVLLQSIDEKSVVQIESDPKPTKDELNSKNTIVENVEPTEEANGGSVDQGSVAQIEADLKTMNEPEIKNVTVDEPETKNVTVDGPETKNITAGNGEMKENGVIIQERNGKVSPASLDLGSDNRGGEAIVKTDEIVATSDAKVSSSRELCEKLIASYNVPAIETAAAADSTHSTNYVEPLKNPEVSKSSDREPSVPSAPRVVQRTSLMNCCGLFEVFSRS